MSHPCPPLTSTRPARPLAGHLPMPGDKAISHLALMLASLTVGETAITGLLENEDISRTAAAVEALGADVARNAPGVWRIAGRGIGGLREPADVLDMGNSATAARLLCGILASHDLFAVVAGGTSLRRRPMRCVTDPLQACGAQFQGRDGGRLPLAIRGARDALPIEHRAPAASAQVKSALLLAGLNAPGWTRIEEPAPTHDHTERMLRHFGAEVAVEHAGAGRIAGVMGQPELRAADVAVPGDPSLAAFPLVAALIVPGSVVTVRGVGLNPLRTGLFATLREMGARLETANERLDAGEPVGDVTATYTGLHGADVPPERVPGMANEGPILAVAAACAIGTTRIRGSAGLQMKEDGCLAATAAMLAANGARVEIEGDNFIVHGGGAALPGGGRVEAHTDHRIAMSALVLGLAAAAPVGVDGPASINTSFPGFAASLRGLGATIA